MGKKIKLLRQLLAFFIFIFFIIGCEKRIVKDEIIQDISSKDSPGINHRYLRVAVVSCAKIQEVKHQQEWDYIRNVINPDLLLLVGDIVYLDKKHRKRNWYSITHSMEEIFNSQWEEEHFKKLINEVPYFAIWDDHDAGTDNITPQETSSDKQEMFQEARVSFTKRIFNKDKIELYTRIKDFKVNNKKIDFRNQKRLFKNNAPLDYSFEMNDIQFIMLDGVSSRSKRNILSNEQFKLLDEKLKNHNGLTILSTGASLRFGDNQWRWNSPRYKKDYVRLIEILNNNKRVIILTGDIHENATIKPSKTVNFYELISSGIARDYVKGNFLVLDINNNSLQNSWNINFQHYGNKMKKGYGIKKGTIRLP